MMSGILPPAFWPVELLPLPGSCELPAPEGEVAAELEEAMEDEDDERWLLLDDEDEEDERLPEDDERPFCVCWPPP